MTKKLEMVISWEATTSACCDLLQEGPHSSCKGINSNSGLEFYGEYDQMATCIKTGMICTSIFIQVPRFCSLSRRQGSQFDLLLLKTNHGRLVTLLNKQGLVITNAHLLETWRCVKTSVNGDRIGTRSKVAIITDKRMKLESLGDENPRDFVTNESALSELASAILHHKNARGWLDSMDP